MDTLLLMPEISRSISKERNVPLYRFKARACRELFFYPYNIAPIVTVALTMIHSEYVTNINVFLCAIP